MPGRGYREDGKTNVGMAVSAVFKACGENMAYGDYKASAGTPGLQSKVSDLVPMDTTAGALLFPVEIKTPWVPAHFCVSVYDNKIVTPRKCPFAWQEPGY